MPRLPDINLETYLQSQRERFQEATAGLLPALEFQLGTRTTEAEIPPDFDAPGGRDQWEEVEKQRLEEEYRRQQQEAEALRQQQIQQQADQYAQQQQQAEAAEAAKAEQARQEQNQASVMDQIRALGIPLPGSPFADHSASAGLTDIQPAQAEPLSDVDQFNASAGGLMIDAFGAPTPDPSTPNGRDNESSAGLLDRLGSAASSVGETIGSAASSAGTALGSAASSVGSALWDAPGEIYRGGAEAVSAVEDSPLYQQVARPGIAAATGVPDIISSVRETERAAGNLADVMGAGSIVRGATRQEELEREMEPYRDQSQGPSLRRLQAFEVPATWQAAHPEQAAEYEEIRRQQENIAAGATNPSGMGKLAPEAVGAIKSLIKHGVSESAILQMEQELANKSDLALSAVQKLTRGLTEEAPTAARVAAEVLPESAPTVGTVPDNASSAGLVPEAMPRMPEAVPEVPNVAPNVPRPSTLPETPYTRGLTAEDLGIPEGMTRAEDMPPRTTREPGASIRGFGTLPEHLAPPLGGGASMSQEGEDVLRAVNAEQRANDVPVTARWRHDTITKMLGEEGDAAKVEATLADDMNMSRESAALHQELLKQNVRTWEEAFMTKGNELADAKAKAADFMKQFPDTSVPGELLQAIEAAGTDLKIVEMEYRKNALKQSGFVRAASQRMNAQRGGRQAAVIVSGAQRLEGIGKRLQRIGRAGKAGKIDDALDELGEAAKDLDDVRTRRTLTEPGEGGGGGGGGKAGGTTRPPKPQPPKEETLVERYGRLQREQSRFKNLLDDPARPLDEAAREGIRGELARVGDEIGETTAQARAEALEAAQKRFAADQIKRGGYTEADLDRIADETVGRRAIGKIRREAADEVTGRGALKTSADLTRSVEKAIAKAFKDERRLADRIARQEQRRIDGILSQEARANIRDEVRGISQEAQTWIKRIRQMPDQRSGLQEGFDQVLRDLDEHSASGKKVAAELRERLQNHLDEDAYARSFTQARRETEEVNDAMIRAVQDRIKEVQANPNAPGQAARMAELWDRMEQLGGKGVQKASEMRKGLAQRGLLRSGVMAEGVNAEALSEALRKLNPDDPASFKEMLNLMTSRPNFWDWVRENEMLNMLSNPVTIAQNITSTLGNAGLRVALRNPGKFAGSLGQTKGQLAALQGLAGGAREGARLAGETLRTGINPSRMDRALASGDYRRMGGEATPEIYANIMGSVFGKATGGRGRELGERFGRLWGTLGHMQASRALEAGDALLGHMSYEMGFRELAAQKADDLLFEGGDEIASLFDPTSKKSTRDQLYEHILRNYWDYPDLVEKAGKIEDYTLSRSRDSNFIENGLRSWMKVKELPPNPTKADYAKSFFVDLIMPFYNVPVNTTKQGAKNLGEGLASPISGSYAWATAARGVKTGGAEGRAARKLAGERMGRAAQGGILLAVPFAYGMEGNITGPGPKDPGQKAVWLRTHQPYSFRPLGARGPWISYENTPAAIPFGAVGGLFDALDQMKDEPNLSPLARAGTVAGGAARGTLQGALSQSMLKGLRDTLGELDGDTISTQTLVQALMSNVQRYSPHTALIPAGSNLVNFLAGITDSVQRETGRARSPDDALEIAGNLARAWIPGLRETLPVKRGAFGEAVRNERSGGLGLIPGYRGYAPGEGDPISEQLQEAHVGIPRVPNELTYKRGKIPITITEQQRYQQLYGERYREYLENMNVGREPTNSAALEAIRTKAHDAAQNTLMGEIGSEELSRRWYYEAPREVAP